MRNEADRPVPRQRTKDLAVRTQGDGTLILDRRTDTAHYLPPEVTRVWGACNGSTTVAEIASAAGINEQIAASAVDQLMTLDLLEVPGGINRRKFLGRGALVGAGVLTVPVIESVVAAPAYAQTTTTIALLSTCTPNKSAATFQVELMGWRPSSEVGGPYMYTVQFTGDTSMMQINATFSGTVTVGAGGSGTGTQTSLASFFPFNPTPVTVTIFSPTGAFLKSFSTIYPGCLPHGTNLMQVTTTCDVTTGKATLTLTMTGFASGMTYYVDFIEQGQVYPASRITVTTDKGGNATVGPVEFPVINFTTPITFTARVWNNRTSTGASALVKSMDFTMPACEGPIPGLGVVRYFPRCVSSNKQAQFNLSFTGGTPNRHLQIEALATPPGGGDPIDVFSTAFNLNVNGNATSPTLNIPSSGYSTETFNVFGVPTPITIRIIDTDTNTVVATIDRTIGPCYNPSVGRVTLTPSCGGSNGQAGYRLDLSGFDNLAILTITVTAQGATMLDTETFHVVTTATGGTAVVPQHDFGPPFEFTTATAVNIRVEQGGALVANYPGTIGPCPVTAAAPLPRKATASPPRQATPHPPSSTPSPSPSPTPSKSSSPSPSPTPSRSPSTRPSSTAPRSSSSP